MQLDDIWSPMNGYVVLNVANYDSGVKSGYTLPTAINLAHVVSITLNKSGEEGVARFELNVHADSLATTLYCALPDADATSGQQATLEGRFVALLKEIGTVSRSS